MGHSRFCNALEMVPQQTLQDRTILRGSSVIHQKLVQWQELPSSMATWEDTTVLLKKYPKLLA
jgi:hypothetical protein